MAKDNDVFANNDESLLSSGESHVDLVFIGDESHVYLSPTDGGTTVNLVFGQRSHSYVHLEPAEGGALVDLVSRH